MASKFTLEGRTALVTGAGAGLGAAVAKALAQQKAHVFVTDINAEAARDTANEIRELGGKAEAMGLDVADAVQAAAVAKDAAELGNGTLNIVVNNAGIIAPAMFKNMSSSDFQWVLDVHVGGTFTVTQAALPYLADDGSGRIINVTSAAGLTGAIGQVNYSAAKAGIIGLTKSFAKELARRGITSNAIAPLAATNMTNTIRTDEKLAARTLERIPMQRWAEPEEIASTFVYFASDASGYVTGQVLPVDGGMVI